MAVIRIGDTGTTKIRDTSCPLKEKKEPQGPGLRVRGVVNMESNQN